MNKTEALKTFTGLSALERPLFKPGLLLEDEDLTATVDYTRNMMQLMFRSLFGCGVVCGLDVTAKLECNGQKLVVSVAKGVALDCMGEVIEVPASTTVEYELECNVKFPPYIWVAVCYHEKCCRPRDISCSPDDDGRPVPTRSVSGYEVKLYGAKPACSCSCEPPQTEKPQTANGRCDDKVDGNDARSEVAKNGAANAVTLDPCACYEDDLKGVCACDCGCGCECVILGKIDTSKFSKEKPEIDDENVGRNVRRFIRPVPAGYLIDCLKLKPKGAEFLQPLSEKLDVLRKEIDDLKKKLSEATTVVSTTPATPGGDTGGAG